MSKTLTVALDDATTEQLRMYLEQTCGITTHRSSTKEQLKAKVRAVYDGSELTLLVDDIPEPQPASPPLLKEKNVIRMSSKGGRGDPVVELTLMEQEGPAGKRAEFFSVNGKGITIPRSIRCRVPYRYYLVMKDAKRTEITHENQGVTVEEVRNEVPQYNFQVHVMPSDEEIKAWHERTRHQFAA